MARQNNRFSLTCLEVERLERRTVLSSGAANGVAELPVHEGPEVPSATRSSQETATRSSQETADSDGAQQGNRAEYSGRLSSGPGESTENQEDWYDLEIRSESQFKLWLHSDSQEAPITLSLQVQEVPGLQFEAVGGDDFAKPVLPPGHYTMRVFSNDWSGDEVETATYRLIVLDLDPEKPQSLHMSPAPVGQINAVNDFADPKPTSQSAASRTVAMKPATTTINRPFVSDSTPIVTTQPIGRGLVAHDAASVLMVSFGDGQVVRPSNNQNWTQVRDSVLRPNRADQPLSRYVSYDRGAVDDQEARAEPTTTPTPAQPEVSSADNLPILDIEELFKTFLSRRREGQQPVEAGMPQSEEAYLKDVRQVAETPDELPVANLAVASTSAVFEEHEEQSEDETGWYLPVGIALGCILVGEVVLWRSMAKDRRRLPEWLGGGSLDQESVS